MSDTWESWHWRIDGSSSSWTGGYIIIALTLDTTHPLPDSLGRRANGQMGQRCLMPGRLLLGLDWTVLQWLSLYSHQCLLLLLLRCLTWAVNLTSFSRIEFILNWTPGIKNTGKLLGSDKQTFSGTISSYWLWKFVTVLSSGKSSKLLILILWEKASAAREMERSTVNWKCYICCLCKRHKYLYPEGWLLGLLLSRKISTFWIKTFFFLLLSKREQFIIPLNSNPWPSPPVLLVTCMQIPLASTEITGVCRLCHPISLFIIDRKRVVGLKWRGRNWDHKVKRQKMQWQFKDTWDNKLLL